MNITDMFEINSSEEITQTIDRLYEKYDHEKLPVPTPTPTFTYTVSMTPSITPTYTETTTPSITPTYTPTDTTTPSITPTHTDTMTPSITPTYTDTTTPSITPTYTDTMTPSITPTDTMTVTITRTLTRIEVGFNEYNGEYVQMSVLIPDDKTLTGFAFDHSDAEYYNIAMAAQNVSPNVFIYEPSTIDTRIKRCAFITQSGVKNRIDILYKYTATARQDKNTQEYTGPKIQGLRVTDFIAYDENRQEIQYEIQDALIENSALNEQSNES